MNAIAHFQYFKKIKSGNSILYKKNVYITDMIHINNIHCYILISKYLKLLYISATQKKKDQYLYKEQFSYHCSCSSKYKEKEKKKAKDGHAQQHHNHF